jgi:hypothetical protein
VHWILGSVVVILVETFVTTDCWFESIVVMLMVLLM